jgi:anti-sigma factor RsiW
MNDAEFNLLLETAARRKLTAGEKDRLRACLAGDPAAKTIWEEEEALTAVLGGLPDAPISSNFTAQVLRRVERDERNRRTAPAIFRWLRLRRPAHQFVAAGVTLVLLALGHWQYRTAQREKMAAALAKVARSVETVSQIAPLPAMEMWKDYEPISRLALTRPEADQELIEVLNEIAMK